MACETKTEIIATVNTTLFKLIINIRNLSRDIDKKCFKFSQNLYIFSKYFQFQKFSIT